MSNVGEDWAFDVATGRNAPRKESGALSPEAIAQFDGEDALSRKPDDPHYCFPEIPPGARALGVGDGGGWEGQESGTELFWATDPDPDAAVYRRQRWPNVNFKHGFGEVLEFPDGEFTFLYSRGAIMFMDIPRFCREAARVTRPGAQVWIMYHSWRKTVDHLFDSLRRGHWKNVLFRLYVLLNGLLFHFTGKLMRLPIKGNLESFQTRHALVREFERAGFTNVRFPAKRPGQIPNWMTATRV